MGFRGLRAAGRQLIDAAAAVQDEERARHRVEDVLVVVDGDRRRGEILRHLVERLGENPELTRHRILGMHQRALGMAASLVERVDLSGRASRSTARTERSGSTGKPPPSRVSAPR